MAIETLNKKALKIDVNTSTANFSVKKIGLLTVKGSLSDLNGTIIFDENDLNSSSFDVNANTATINTGSEKRDEHLKSEDFFFVKNYPSIRFKSTSIKATNGTYQAIGNLTILETTKEITIPFTFENNVFSGSFSINRLDYNLGKKFPTLVVGKNIQISINCKIN